MVLLLRKLYIYLYFTKDPEGVHYFPGGCQTFSGGGPNDNFFRNPHVRTCYFPEGVGVSGPPILLWIRTWAMPS